MQASGQTHGEREHFFGAAKVVAGMTMTSRILGLVRDMVLIPLGGPRLADAFWTAFSVPHLFRRLFGEGALSAAFVPVFTGVAEKSGWDRARAVLANVSGILALVLAGLVVVGELGLWLGSALWPGDWAHARLLQFTAIMLPFMFTVCLLALGSAALNCKGHFAYPAAAPILLNIGLIVTAWWIAPAVSKAEDTQFMVIAAGLVVTGIVQLVGVVWLLKRSGLAVVPRLRPVLGETKAITAHMLPMFVPLGIIQLSAFADRLIALIFTATPQNLHFPLQAGIVRCLHVANRLYQLPLGVMAISIATVVFPLFSRYAARNDIAGLRDTTNRALRLCIFLGLPAAAGLMILAEPLVTVIFERGAFSAEDTRRAAFILQMYCLGMVAYFCNHILLRAFFARGETTAPLRIACILAGVNVLLVVGGIFTPLKGGAIGLATAVTATANTAALTIVLRRRLKRIGFAQILASLARIIAAVTAMAAAVWAVRFFFPAVTGDMSGKWAVGAVTAVGVVVGAAVYLLAAIVCRCPEVGELLGALRKKPPIEQ